MRHLLRNLRAVTDCTCLLTTSTVASGHSVASLTVTEERYPRRSQPERRRKTKIYGRWWSQTTDNKTPCILRRSNEVTDWFALPDDPSSPRFLQPRLVTASVLQRLSYPLYHTGVWEFALIMHVLENA